MARCYCGAPLSATSTSRRSGRAPHPDGPALPDPRPAAWPDRGRERGPATALAGVDGPPAPSARQRSWRWSIWPGALATCPTTYSGGQRQRVALARALITDPPVVLADEPTGSLDSATATAMLEALLRLLRVRNTALVMVTHDAQAAARADRVIRLRDGHLDHADQQRDVMTHGGGRA